MIKGKMIAAAVLCALVYVSPNAADAAQNQYICEITEYRFPPGADTARDWVGKEAMKTSVAIDRKTGRVIHPWIGNTSFENIQLIDPGSSEWSFKVIATSGTANAHLNAQYYEVHEYSESPSKPFLAVVSGIAFFGHCD